MKVIKIHKTFRGGSRDKMIVVTSTTEEGIQEEVEDWCDSDGGGQENGYRCTFDEVTDKDEVNIFLLDYAAKQKIALAEYVRRTEDFIKEIHQFVYSNAISRLSEKFKVKARNVAECKNLQLLLFRNGISWEDGNFEIYTCYEMEIHDNKIFSTFRHEHGNYTHSTWDEIDAPAYDIEDLQIMEHNPKFK